jgi:hypothetical protein
LIDIIAAQSLSVSHRRSNGRERSYRGRTGFPQGVEAARGAARDFKAPSDMRATPARAYQQPRASARG